MQLTLIWLMILCAGGCAFCVYMLIRNDRVSEYRKALLNKIHQSGEIDINLGRDWRWRYDEFDRVDYETMLNKFWRRLDSFYPDLFFTEPDGTSRRNDD